VNDLLSAELRASPHARVWSAPAVRWRPPRHAVG